MSNVNRRFVVDTNTLVSRLLIPNSVPAKAVSWALNNGKILVSDDTLQELAEVLSREKFNQYISIEDRQEFIRYFARICERVEIIRRIESCRDPKDNKFLELAINGNAEMIISGDNDLLVMSPFQNIKIVRPSDVV